MAPRPRLKARKGASPTSPSSPAIPPKVNNLAAGPPKSAAAPQPTPSTEKAAVVLAPAPPPKSTSPQPSTAPPKVAAPPSPPPKSPSTETKTTEVVPTSVAATTKTKKIHTTTAAGPVGGGKQQPVGVPVAVTFGSAPPTTLTDIPPSTLPKGNSATASITSILVAGAGAATTTGRSTGSAKQLPSLANPAGASNNNNIYPSPSSSLVGAVSTSQRPHVNGTPTSTILAILIVLVLVAIAVIVLIVRRRLKAEERLVLGAGGRGGDGGGGGVKRGWKTLDEDGGGQFADDLKTEHGLGGGGNEMVMSDGASFVWSGQGYRGADVEERERQEQERSYWEQQQQQHQRDDGYEDTSRVTSMYPPTPPRLYAAQMAPPPARPPRPGDGIAAQGPVGTRNLYAPNQPAGGRPGQARQLAPPVNQPSYSSASSLHPSHAVTHHLPVRTRSKTAAGGGGARDLLRQNIGQLQEQERAAETGGQQDGQDRASGSFGSLMMRGYDEEGAMTPLPTHPLSPTFLPYHQDDSNAAFPARTQASDTLAVDGFVPLSQMAFERTEAKYRSPIESIFETYEGADESRVSYVYT